MSKSPYLKDEHRLADVIAAIQVLGIYKFYKLDFAGWADRITGSTSTAEHWRAVFEEHPEFFRLDSARQKASLVLRRQRQRLYNVDEEAVWPKDRYNALPVDAEEKDRFSRLPLTPNEIEALIDVAISLHSRAMERARERRWLVALLVPFLGALLGSAVTAIVKSESDKPVLSKPGPSIPAATPDR